MIRHSLLYLDRYAVVDNKCHGHDSCSVPVNQQLWIFGLFIENIIWKSYIITEVEAIIAATKAIFIHLPLTYTKVFIVNSSHLPANLQLPTFLTLSCRLITFTPEKNSIGSIRSHSFKIIKSCYFNVPKPSQYHFLWTTEAKCFAIAPTTIRCATAASRLDYLFVVCL